MTLLMIAAAAFSCAGRRSAAAQAADGATVYGYKVVATYPHSTGSYTQGLFWHDGRLYEGTGGYGQSALMTVDLETGKAGGRVDIPSKFFGEGIALLGDKIYQLTWMEGLAFVYDAATFAKTGEIGYRGEGWGLTSDGEKLYMSDGSDKIYTVDPVDFRRTSTINIRQGNHAVDRLNELEWIDGEIWANVYMTDRIVRIDPATGTVTGVVELTDLLPFADRAPDTDVLNGIAYDPTAGRIFVTGKNWPKLFEIELIER